MLGPIVLAIVASAACAAAADTQAAVAQQPPVSPAQATVEKPWPPPGVVRMGAGVVSPKLLKETKPNYTAAAMDAKVTGGIELEVVVEADGKVGEVRVNKSLDREFGLDEEAVKTVKQWEFLPGRKDGVAIPVLVTVEMTFTLRK